MSQPLVVMRVRNCKLKKTSAPARSPRTLFTVTVMMISIPTLVPALLQTKTCNELPNRQNAQNIKSTAHSLSLSLSLFSFFAFRFSLILRSSHREVRLELSSFLPFLDLLLCRTPPASSFARSFVATGRYFTATEFSNPSAATEEGEEEDDECCAPPLPPPFLT